MEKDTIPLEVMLTIPNCSVMEIENGIPKQVDNGILQIVNFQTYQTYCLIVNEFKYSLSKEIPIARNINQWHYILPYLNCYYAIIIPQTTDKEFIEALEVILAQYSTFSYLTAVPNAEKEEEKKMEGIPPPKVLKKGTCLAASAAIMTKPDEELTSSEKIAKYLRKGGDYLKIAIVEGAKLASTGIKKGGDLLTTYVIPQKAEPITISESTKMKILMAKTASGSILSFTKAKMSALVEMAGTIGKEIVKGVGGAQGGKGGKFEEIANHPMMEPVMDVGGAAVNCAANIYDGMFEAMVIVAGGVCDASVDVVEHRYGEEAGKALGSSLETGMNVVQVVKAGSTATAKSLAKQTALGAVNEATSPKDLEKPK